MAEGIFLMIGEHVSKLKGMYGNLFTAINKSFPLNHEVSRAIWALHHHLTVQVCSELDNDICRYYPMNVHSIDNKSLTSIFYTTEQVEDPFKDKPYGRRRLYSKQVTHEEKEYLHKIIDTLFIIQSMVLGHPELFREKSINTILKTDDYIQKLNHSIGGR